ncbi:glycosyltransferase family 4 protein [Luteibacter sp. PPL201]|uniref:Glycosyltransferase family 4 protein n=1 Tax=Luteibacter sahnii TaxID=3021977 RepID=A0ABT6B7R8_9GAMM|nr:glycosyltransferase family 4 protein [Luteibacter sp. PPL193]MDY1548138.1 glycosyltransferase family 4 protein [Luteibacter sp. PPL193]
MHIFVISDLPQFVTGGAEMQAYRLATAWIAEGHEVTVAGRRMRPGYLPLENGAMLRTLRIRTWSRGGRALRAVTYALSLGLLLIRHRKRFDIVYARFLNEGAAVTALLKRWGWLSRPLVAVPANVRGTGDVHALQRLPMSNQVIDLLSRECDAINLIAGAMVDELDQAGFDASRYTRIPNGIPLRDATPRVPRHPPTFLTVGRLAPQKGLDLLIRSLALHRTRLSPGQVRVAGDGPEHPRLASLARELGVDHAIDWLGELSPADVQRELEHADVFLLASRYEGMSNAGLEAMERGKPLLITRCGGLDEYIGEGNGWVAEPEDVESLATALSNALDATPEVLMAMGAANRAMVKDRFEMTLVAKRYLGLFDTLIQRRSGPSDDLG